MKKKRILRRGFVQLVGLYLLIWSLTGSAGGLSATVVQQEALYSVKDVRCDHRKEAGQVIRVRVRILNEGLTNPGTVLTVFGLQGGVQIFLTPEEGFLVFAEPGERAAEETFYYSPTTGGEIQWQAALVGGDLAFCSTDVPPVGGDDNSLPVAHDQAISTNEDTPVAITLTASDSDGDTLTYSVVTNPANGTLSGTAPNLTYSPDSGFHGSDSFNFKANDGRADSNTATVFITVEEADEGGEPTPTGLNIVALHDRNSKQYNKNCKECHSEVHSRTSLNPAIPAAHVAMLPFAAGKVGEDKQCMWCHRSVDLVAGTQPEGRSGGNFGKYVDARLCALCHGPGGPGKQFYQSSLNLTDGALLYDLACSGCHKPLMQSNLRGKPAEKLRDAIDHDKGGMAPLAVLSDEQLAAIAVALEEN